MSFTFDTGPKFSIHNTTPFFHTEQFFEKCFDFFIKLIYIILLSYYSYCKDLPGNLFGL